MMKRLKRFSDLLLYSIPLLYNPSIIPLLMLRGRLSGVSKSLLKLHRSPNQLQTRALATSFNSSVASQPVGQP